MNGISEAVWCQACAASTTVRDVTVFRAVNRGIVNGLFLLVFLGAPILTVAATAPHLDVSRREALPCLVAGLLLGRAELERIPTAHHRFCAWCALATTASSTLTR